MMSQFDILLNFGHFGHMSDHVTVIVSTLALYHGSDNFQSLQPVNFVMSRTHCKHTWLCAELEICQQLDHRFSRSSSQTLSVVDCCRRCYLQLRCRLQLASVKNSAWKSASESIQERNYARWPFTVKKCTSLEETLLQRFLCEYCRRESCKAFTDLSVQKWLVEDDPFCVKIWSKLTRPLQKRGFPI